MHSWYINKKNDPDNRGAKLDAEADEHKRIMQEAVMLDKLSDCSADVPQEQEGGSSVCDI